MATLFKYLATVAVIVSAVIVSAIFSGFAPVIESPAITTPGWKLDRLKTEPDVPYIARGSLSPIYPATPGKELLGKPVQTVVRIAKSHRVESVTPVVKLVNAKRRDVRQVLWTHKLPRQIYAGVERDRNYSQQSYGYAEEPHAQSRTFNIIAHDLY
jgi:hypothetical protein